jgi:hypothetical protein
MSAIQKQYPVFSRLASLAGIGTNFIQGLPTGQFNGIVPTSIYVECTNLPTVTGNIETVNLGNNNLEFIPDGATSSGNISITPGTYADNNALAAAIQTDLNTFADLNYAGQGYSSSIIVTWNAGTSRYEIASTAGNFSLRFDSATSIGPLIGFGMFSYNSSTNFYTSVNFPVDIATAIDDPAIYIISDMVSAVDTSNIDPSLAGGRIDILNISLIDNNLASQGIVRLQNPPRLPLKYGDVPNSIRNNTGVSFPLFGLRLPSGRALVTNVIWDMVIVFETVSSK